jgi:uncharacterized protein (TIGR03437 family)
VRNRILTLSLFLAATGFGQVLSNSSLTGKYFVRHVQFTTDANNNATDTRSIFGTITFDGAGNYVIAGNQVIGTNSGTVFNANGTYAMTPSGIVTLVNPQNAGLTINARFGTEAVVGSSTDAGSGIFDMFMAIPAPSSNASNLTLGSSFHMADWELTVAQTQQVRVSGMSATLDGAGNIQTFRPLGHLAAGGGNTLAGQEFTGTYTVTSNGTGIMAFTAVAGTIDPIGPLLQPNSRNLYVSATGNVFFAVLPGSHDILIGIRNATTSSNVSFAGRYWLDGLAVNSGASSDDFVAAGSVVTSANTILYSSRYHQVPPIAADAPSLLNETQSETYAFLLNGLGMGCGCGIGADENVVVTGTTFLMSGNNGTLLALSPSVDVNGTTDADTSTYLIMFGQQIPNLTGPLSGIFLNPQGIVNAATYAPVGDYVSPGEFIEMFGAGFVASGTATASSLPFQNTLDGVSVTINGVSAPMYYVSPGEVICIVPYELTGTTATIVVFNGAARSNSVTVGAAPSSPGVFSANDSGYGDGAITHVNNSSVNTNNPAAPLETVQMYVSGLGALSTPVTDGNGAVGIDDAVIKPLVYVNGVKADVGYWGLTVDAGLYQINFTVPAGTPNGEQTVGIFMLNGATGAYTQTITIAIQAVSEAGL